MNRRSLQLPATQREVADRLANRLERGLGLQVRQRLVGEHEIWEPIREVNRRNYIGDNLAAPIQLTVTHFCRRFRP